MAGAVLLGRVRVAGRMEMSRQAFGFLPIARNADTLAVTCLKKNPAFSQAIQFYYTARGNNLTFASTKLHEGNTKKRSDFIVFLRAVASWMRKGAIYDRLRYKFRASADARNAGLFPGRNVVVASLSLPCLKTSAWTVRWKESPLARRYFYFSLSPLAGLAKAWSGEIIKSWNPQKKHFTCVQCRAIVS